MEKRQVNVGIIGCGAFAEGQNIPNSLTNPDVRIGAICDLRPKRLEDIEKKFDLVGVFKTTNSEEIFNNPDIDAVLLATDHNTHLQLVEKAAASGKHIFIEKPMTMDFDEAVKILRIVENSGIKLCVDYNRPFSPAMQFLKQQLEKQKHNGTLSPWRSRRANGFQRLFEEKATNLAITINDEIDSYHPVHIDVEKGGGQIIGESCHFLDLACWLIGRQPVRIFATGSTRLSHVIIINFDDGSIANIHFSVCGTFDYPKERYEITSNGALFLNEYFVETSVYGREQVVKEFYPMQCDELQSEVPGEGFVNFLEKRNLAQTRFHNQGRLPALNPDKGHKHLLNEFIKAIISGTPAPVDARRGLRATYLANLAIKSIRLGMPLPVLRESLEVFVDE